MSNTYTSEAIADFIDFLDAAMEEIKMSEDTLNKVNYELCDLEHFIEFGRPTAPQQHQIYKRLKAARVERRAAKENIEICTPIKDWMRENNKIIKSLRQLLSSVQRIEHLQSSRAYAIRTDILKDITDKTHLVSVNDPAEIADNT